MKILFFPLLIILFSWKNPSNNFTIVYKDLGNVNRSSEITIEGFWSFKEFDIDSLKLNNNQSKKFNKIVSNVPGKHKTYIPFLNPQYAFKIFFRGKTDTLYLDSEFQRGYFTNAKWEIEDKQGRIKKNLQEVSEFFKQ